METEGLEMMQECVPQWIRKSEWFKNNQDINPIIFPMKILSQNIGNIEEWKILVNFCCMIDVEYPYTVYTYGYYNKEEVIEYLLSELDNEHYRYYIENCKSIKESGKLYDKFVEILNKMQINNEKRQTILLNYPRDPIMNFQYTNLVFYDKFHTYVQNILLQYNESELYDLYQDIKTNMKMAREIDLIYQYCLENVYYTNSQKLIEEYEKSIKYEIIGTFIIENTPDQEEEICVSENTDISSLNLSKTIRINEITMDFYANKNKFFSVDVYCYLDPPEIGSRTTTIDEQYFSGKYDPSEIFVEHDQRYSIYIDLNVFNIHKLHKVYKNFIDVCKKNI